MRIKLLMACFLLAATGLRAQAPQQDDDFVRASLLTIGPGNKVYSLYGHTALRLECPVHGLDYCFTFEMALTTGEQLRFLLSTAKAGFIAAPTGVFFDNYRKEGRSISQQQLNLRPREEQQLWRMLDEELKRGAHWDYNFLTTNCSSMCVWMVERALSTEGEQIVYGTLPAALTGTYGDLLDDISADAPWARLFWQIRMGSRSAEQGTLRDKLAPALLSEAWAAATIADSTGHRRPMLTGEPQQIAPQTKVVGRTWFTPVVAVIMLIFITIMIFLLTKKRTIMKKFLTSMRSKRLMLSAALVMTSALNALAGGTDWYAYKVQAEAYPTGAGLVYVDVKVLSEEDIKWAEKVDREFTTTDVLGYGYAKANEGWQLLGFAKDTIDAAGNMYRIDSVASLIDETGISLLNFDKGVTSKSFDPMVGQEVSDDSLTVAAKMPLEPNNYFRALFTRVAVKVNPLQTSMGKVKIDKLINNIGDQVTITATPANDFCSFVNWTCNGEVVSTEPQLSVTVSKADTYVANFSDSRAVTLHFPAEGGYMPFYSNYNYELHGQLEAYSPMLYYSMINDELVDSVQAVTNQRISHLMGVTSSYYLQGKKGAILYGQGDVTIAPDGADEASDDESYSCGLLRWSGEQGVQVETLPTEDAEKELTYIYYTFDIDKLQFNHITTGTIAPNSVYMRIFGNMVGAGLEAPEVIYYNEDVESQVLGIRDVKGPKAVKKQGIYTLDGRKVEAPARGGIYVTDGRKIIVR